MTTAFELSVRIADWEVDGAALRAIREAVFVREQQVPVELEWDGLDAECMHVLAEAAGKPIGTGRLLRDGRIGRMAVLAEWRGRGVGRMLLEFLVESARQRGHAAVVLHAQVRAIPFYVRCGFRPVGEEFMDAGIAHRTMILHLA